MTRLFLRFFLGVIAILIVALMIQGVVLSVGRARQTEEQLERSLRGAALLAGEFLLRFDPIDLLTKEQIKELTEEQIKEWTEEQINERIDLLAKEQIKEMTEERVNEWTEEQINERMEELQAKFDFPIRLVQWWSLSLNSRQKSRLEAGEIVAIGNNMLAARLSQDGMKWFNASVPPDPDLELQLRKFRLSKFRLSNDYVLRFGPVPTAQGPGQRQIMVGLGLVMLLTAIAIAILLRPVAIPLRAVERTATAIAEGDLSARIDPRNVPRGLALGTAFNKMASRTENLLRSQKELLQAVSHELRTPLARIRFATDLIETAKTDQERNERLKSVDSATQRLDDLVGELLTYVRLESDVRVDQPEPIELNKMFDQLIDMYAPLHQGIEYKIVNTLPNIQVTADRRSLARAIGNLLSNAGRYAKTEVSVLAIQQRDGVLIHVDDDGVGIHEEDRAKVFDPFVRLTPGDGKGTGLGLALVDRIATRYGGWVRVDESNLGGARFSFFMPHEME